MAKAACWEPRLTPARRWAMRTTWGRPPKPAAPGGAAALCDAPGRILGMMHPVPQLDAHPHRNFVVSEGLRAQTQLAKRLSLLDRTF